MSERVTLATATGLPLASLVFHVGMGLIAISAGYIAIAVRKGAKLHRQSGLAFVFAMIGMGLTGMGISLYEGKETFTGGLAASYFVFTAWTTVRPLPRAGRQVDIALMMLAFTLGAFGLLGAFTALGRPGRQIEGAPAGMLFFLTTITLLAAVGDARMIHARGIQGARRLARHLWRMCFGLFIAAGSFFLGQMKFIPEPIRSLPLLFGLSLAPLVLLLYWMWRVRLRHNLRNILTAKPLEARQSAA